MSSTNRGGKKIADDFYETQPPTIAVVAGSVCAVLEDFSMHEGHGVAPRVFEPNAGRGAIVKSLFVDRRVALTAVELDQGRYRELSKVRMNSEIGGQLTTICGDVLEMEFVEGQFTVGITNPAFSIAMPVVELMLGCCEHVFALLRLGMMASKGRRAFWKNNPADAIVLAERPSFAASLKCVGIAKRKPLRGVPLGSGGSLGSRGVDPCGWQVIQPLDWERATSCPDCGCSVVCSTTDSADYAWFHWSPKSRRAGGTWRVA